MSARAVTLWFIDTDTPVDVLRSGVTNDVDAAKTSASDLGSSAGSGASQAAVAVLRGEHPVQRDGDLQQ